MAQILGQKSPFGGLCTCVRQKWGHANDQLRLQWFLGNLMYSNCANYEKKICETRDYSLDCAPGQKSWMIFW